MYDIIGDVHGYASLLKKLLLQIGYIKTESGYTHPSRKAIFVGDFVNRGPEIRKTVRIIRKMVENGNALAIIGNHEINAITYYLKDKDGLPLIKSPGKNFLALYKTINQFAEYQEDWKSHRKWISELPFYLDLGEIRIVHACWSESAIETIKTAESEGKSRSSIFRKVYKKPKSPVSKSVLKLTKGIDYKMPGDLKIINNKGVSPQSFRMRWWEDPDEKTFEEMSFDSKFALPHYEIPKQIAPQNTPYPENAPIVFFGHYCRHEGPFIIKPNLCCVDSCVAGTRILTAYRWNGEKALDINNLVQVQK
jgi:hypothetical protein